MNNKKIIDQYLKNKVFIFLFLASLLIFPYSCQKKQVKSSVIYDFSFAELAKEYYDSGDTAIISQIATTKGAEHIYRHAKQFSRNGFDYGLPLHSRYSMIKELLSPYEVKKKKLPDYKRTIQYAKDSVKNTDIIPTIVKEYLPEDFKFRDPTHLFFTLGYDLGVAFAGNASINLAHPHYLNNLQEIKYYAIHELHHAGVLQIRGDSLPSIDFKSHREVSSFIEYFTQLEGMATYATYEIRRREGSLDTDEDYVVLRNMPVMQDLEKEFFEIYEYFRKKPDLPVNEDEWDLIFTLSDKRIWYRFGAKMAKDIDSFYGRKFLTNLLHQDPELFITEYRRIMKQLK